MRIKREPLCWKRQGAAWSMQRLSPKYTLIDDLLASIICNYYFGARKNGKLWRTKRFRIFVQGMLDNIYVMNKRQIVNDIKTLPKGINSQIGLVSDIRNAVAHSLFPNLRFRVTPNGCLPAIPIALTMILERPPSHWSAVQTPPSPSYFHKTDT